VRRLFTRPSFYNFLKKEKRLSAYQAITPEDLIKKINEKTIFIGDGVRTYADYLRDALPSLAIFPFRSMSPMGQW
jgi:hypothetical protein